ncbi:MAG: peptide ABC transporter substrate-binding protein [Pseudonocardiaceae bacterium]|nr:peptide ABC transporter substrate-binding protein [Pseudonocardiaceae bacterium]
MDDYQYHLLEEIRANRLTRRTFMRRASVAGLSLASMNLILSGCGPAATERGRTDPDNDVGPPRRGGTARIALPPPTAAVDPVQMDNIGANMTVPVAAEYLAYPDSDYVLKPALSTKWRAVNPERPDAWEFTIRQGVKFHDGRPMTVDDVVASIARLANPASNSPALTNFDGILTDQGVEKVDARTVRFNLERPFADFPYAVSAFNYNTVILPKDYEIGEFDKGGVGTGPYILSNVHPKVRAEFVRNPDYWHPKLPYLDKVVVQYFNDTASAVLAIQAGEVDLYANTPYQGSEALFGDPNIFVYENDSSEYRAVHMRVDKPPFDDKRVRQAVAYSLDRQALIDGLFGGRAKPGNDHGFAPIFPVSDRAIENIAQRTQDYAKAKSLLRDAGHPNGIDVALTCEDYLEEPAYGVSLGQQAKGANIRINVKTMPQAQYYGSADSGQPWLTVPFGLTGWGERGTAVQLIAPALTSRGVWNSSQWSDETFTRLMADLAGTVDLQSQRRIAAEAATIQNEETPAIIAYWVKQLRAKRTNVHGIASGPVSHLEVSKLWKS